MLLSSGAARGFPFSNLSTTDDGYALYFLTNLRQKGTDQNGTAKVFRYTPAGFELIEERPLVSLSDLQSHNRIFQPAISGDGQKLSFYAARNCSSTDCLKANRYEGVIRGASGLLTWDGRIAISRNGGYAVSWYGQDVTLADLNTGSTKKVESNSSAESYSVSDDGQVLRTMPNVSLWTDGTFRQLSTRYAPSAMPDPTARTILYTWWGGTSAYPSAFDVATGKETQLGVFELTAADTSSPSITNDGRTVGFLDTVSDGIQFFTSSTDGTNKRQITYDPDGITAAVLSGNGNIAYVVTGSSRLLRITIASGAVSELLPPTPAVASAQYAGSRARTGSNGSELLATPGAVLQLQGTGLDENGRLRTLTLGDQTIEGMPSQKLTVPQDLIPGTYDLHFKDNSFFEQRITLTVKEYAPLFLQLNNDAPPNLPVPYFQIHGDFHGLVTLDDPARADEVLVSYMVGLGPVTSTAGSILVTPGFTCSGAELLYAGPAPGIAGTYQVNFRVPAQNIARPLTTVTCGWDDFNRGNARVQVPMR